MKAVAPDVNARYQRASELLNDLLAVRGRRRTTRVVTPHTPVGASRCAATLGKRAETSTTACARAKRRSRASAGTAASRSTRDLRAARFVAKRSRC